MCSVKLQLSFLNCRGQCYVGASTKKYLFYCSLRVYCFRLRLLSLAQEYVNLNIILNACCSNVRTSRAVRRIFCLRGQTPHTPNRVLLYTDRVSNWPFLFSPKHT